MRVSLTGTVVFASSLLLILYSLFLESLLVLAAALTILVILYRERGVLEGVDIDESTLRIERVLRSRYIEEGGEIEVILKATNLSDEFLYSVEIMDSTPAGCRVVRGASRGVVGIPPESSVEFRYVIRVLHPGRHEFGDIDVRVRDPLGFFYKENIYKAYDFIVASPRRLLESPEMGTVSRVSGIVVKGRSLRGSYDIYNIREYVSGDDFRKILWKIYARTSRLMVREDYGESYTRTLLIIDSHRDLWGIRVNGSTLMEDLLRLSRDVIEYILSNYSSIDCVVCEEHTVRFVQSISPRSKEKIYNLYINIPYLGGCETPSLLYRYARSLVSEGSRYDIYIVVTTPFSIVRADPREVNETFNMIGIKPYVVMPYSGFNAVLSRNIDLFEIVDMIGRLGGEILVHGSFLRG